MAALAGTPADKEPAEGEKQKRRMKPAVGRSQETILDTPSSKKGEVIADDEESVVVTGESKQPEKPASSKQSKPPSEKKKTRTRNKPRSQLQ